MRKKIFLNTCLYFYAYKNLRIMNFRPRALRNNRIKIQINYLDLFTTMVKNKSPLTIGCAVHWYTNS